MSHPVRAQHSPRHRSLLHVPFRLYDTLMRRCDFVPTGRPVPVHFGPETIEYCCARPRCGNRACTAHPVERIHAACRDPYWHGLGDLVSWLAGLFGLRGGGRCGCARRRTWLNRLAGIRFRLPSVIGAGDQPTNGVPSTHPAASQARTPSLVAGRQPSGEAPVSPLNH
jgi:hypothetical protein